LSKLKNTTDTEIPTLARNTWRNVLAIYCLEVVAEQLSGSAKLRILIDSLIKKEGFKGIDSHHRLIFQIENFLQRISDFGLEDKSPTPLGLNREQIGVLNIFPSNPALTPLLEEASKKVVESGKFALICIDGFDSIVDHTVEARKAIFAGLIDAIHKLSRDKIFSKAFCFKVFLPQELTDGAHAIVWDADKHIMNTRYLKWSVPEFQRFLLRRLHVYSKSKSVRFFDVWHEYMPEKVKNEVHGIEENSFNYILRHTLFRPRQILTHLQKIVDTWDEKSISFRFRVDPTFIPQIVANTNYALSATVINQLEIKYQGLTTFMQSLNGSKDTMSVGLFQDRIKRIFSLETQQEIHNYFNDFFNFGIFGVIVNTPDLVYSAALRRTQQTQFRFGYVGDKIERGIHANLKETDIIAISPMFHEYCGCVASECGAIMPFMEL